jgi:ribose transport system substrate-binding protein
LFFFLFGFGVTGCNKSNVSSPAKTQKNVDVPRRFIFITNGDDPYFDVLNAGLQTGAEKFALADKGLEVVMEKNNATAQGQIDRLRQLVTQADVAGVAISVIQAENVAIVEEMKRLTEKGVSVITVDGDINQKLFSDGRPYYIGTDNLIAGRLLGTAGKKFWSPVELLRVILSSSRDSQITITPEPEWMAVVKQLEQASEKLTEWLIHLTIHGPETMYERPL